LCSAQISKKVEGGGYALENDILSMPNCPSHFEMGGGGNNKSRAVIVPGTTIGSGGTPPPLNSSTAFVKFKIAQSHV